MLPKSEAGFRPLDETPLTQRSQKAYCVDLSSPLTQGSQTQKLGG